MDTPVTEVAERCQERERLLLVWIEYAGRVRTVLDERCAATKDGAPSPAGFEEQIRLAKVAEVEACRSYFRHVNKHDVV